MPEAVELRGASFVANGIPLLRDIDLQFRRHRLNVVIGPNGAGKTTLLRLATGVLRPSAGSIFYDGEPLSSFTPAALARKRAVLSQRIDLPFALRAADIVMIGRYPHHGSPSARCDREIVQQAMDFASVGDRSDQLYPTMSGGEQQLVQLARVLAQIWSEDGEAEHKLLFLDEPMTSLDVHHQIELLALVRALLVRNCTVVAILHDLALALEHGDSFFVLDRGRLLHAADSTADLPRELIEAVFRVRADIVVDPRDGRALWRFARSGRE